ncbi:urease accessory protein UreD [Blastococcus sp. CT_GayMR16]|uniref:urease accessory protein UreD n=1 Tax=Blastococcus sp. CT_GayMR16 TaxID=2559607 RepID=UPI00107376DC|nr:urease accessory protein UreD [Blastococcus sp. CT_GayMR16]TFV87133.1 urease accessory protein [Blastococcus sp. CT_GayMR16]
MKTFVEIVARPGPGGLTVLPVVRASGQLAVRRTGPTTVHLVATAFGPLGGDDAEVSLVVEEGACLAVRSVAAAIALPARGAIAPSAQRITASVDGVLDLRLEPTVVAAGAHHLAGLTVDLGPAGALTATEQVLLGRTGEEPGRWTGTVRVVREGRPLLNTTVGLGPDQPAWLPPVAPRAYASTVHIGDDEADVLTGDDAVRLPLPGGWVTTAWGSELHRVVRAATLLTPGAPVRVPA